MQYGRTGFDPWVGKIPWRRAWQSTPVFLPGESPWTEEPGRLQSMRSQRVGHDLTERLSTHTHTHRIRKGQKWREAVSLGPLPPDLLLGCGKGSLSSHSLVSFFFQQFSQFVHLLFSVGELLLGLRKASRQEENNSITRCRTELQIQGFEVFLRL